MCIIGITRIYSDSAQIQSASPQRSGTMKMSSGIMKMSYNIHTYKQWSIACYIVMLTMILMMIIKLFILFVLPEVPSRATAEPNHTTVVHAEVFELHPSPPHIVHMRWLMVI